MLNKKRFFFNGRFRYDTSVNPKGTMYWQWSILVSSACLYNLIFVSLPAFEEIRISTDSKWLSYNLVADIIYLIDMFVQCKKSLIFRIPKQNFIWIRLLWIWMLSNRLSWNKDKLCLQVIKPIILRWRSSLARTSSWIWFQYALQI